jgi:uncharacterized membrane protein
MQLQILRWANLLCLLALLSLILAAELWFAPSYQGRFWLCLTVTPLLIALRGFLYANRYTHQWMSMVSWLYFAAGVVRAWGYSGATVYYGILQAVLAVVLFGLCCAFAYASAPSRAQPRP